MTARVDLCRLLLSCLRCLCCCCCHHCCRQRAAHPLVPHPPVHHAALAAAVAHGAAGRAPLVQPPLCLPALAANIGAPQVGAAAGGRRLRQLQGGRRPLLRLLLPFYKASTSTASRAAGSSSGCSCFAFLSSAGSTGAMACPNCCMTTCSCCTSPCCPASGHARPVLVLASAPVLPPPPVLPTPDAGWPVTLPAMLPRTTSAAGSSALMPSI